MADGPTPPQSADKQLGDIVADVTAKANLLVKEEIELAKAEVSQKAKRLGIGAGLLAVAGIVEAARAEGSFKSDIPSEFAAMCFYGAIEQLLTGWIFELLPRTEEEFERAKSLVVEAICGGLEAAPAGTAPVSG